jgi:hypothetical protein
LAALTILSVSSAGCGPFGYLKKVAKDASKTVADAEAVGAEEFAPYEYWGSVAYLEQAKVMMAYSEYERSFDYGTRATQLAKEAKVKAERVERGESVQRSEEIAAPDELPEGEEAVEGEGEGDAEAEGGKAKAKAGGNAKVGGGK